MINARTGDGRFGRPGSRSATNPGEWRPTAPSFNNDPAAWVGDVKPFLLESPSQFRTEGPNELTSRRYAKDFNEVKAIGSRTSATRTADQTDIAKFWARPPDGDVEPHLPCSCRATEDLSIVENARLFAMLYLTEPTR